MQEYRATFGENGRIIIPAQLRKEASPILIYIR
jgi:bifunctional DNA-binding transcriptional regulator/antitoxin component of YhaV-PrlF toxin-antitoxin module